MAEYEYITGDRAFIVFQNENHPFELNTVVTILGKEKNQNWKVTDGKQESIVSSLDLFPDPTDT